MDWAVKDNGKFLGLVPIGQDDDLDKDFCDEDGVFRSSHKQVCTASGTGAIKVMKLSKPIPASEYNKSKLPEGG